jgi:hypothetical protein
MWHTMPVAHTFLDEPAVHIPHLNNVPLPLSRFLFLSALLPGEVQPTAQSKKKGHKSTKCPGINVTKESTFFSGCMD